MRGKVAMVILLTLGGAFCFACWYAWASTNEIVLFGKRMAIDQHTVYLDTHGYIIWSRNEHLVHHTSQVADSVATQPVLQANPLLRVYVSELKDHRFAGLRWATYSSSRWGGTAILLIAPAWPISVLLLAYPAVALIRGQYLRQHHAQRHACQRCGYSLTGNVSGICPECGTPVSEEGHPTASSRE